MKSFTLQRAFSAAVALFSLAEWIYLGCETPVLKAIYADFGADPREFDWPHAWVISLHWAWCIPVGILVATGLILKDRWYSLRIARIINIIVFLAGLALAFLWIWGAAPHRMIQTTQLDLPKKIAVFKSAWPLLQSLRFGATGQFAGKSRVVLSARPANR